MAAEFKIGRLRFTWVGAWQPNTTYARDSVTQYEGKTYVCLVPNTSSTNFYDDLYAVPYPYWNLVVDGKSFVGTWAPSTLYSLGNLVIFGGKVYNCTTAHTSTLFATDAANWSEYTEFTGWHPNWTASTAYGLNDIVRWGGIVYKCIANHTSAATYDLGLEANQSAWQVYFSGVDYRGLWVTNHRYKLNDLVKLDADILICTVAHTSGSTITTADWATWLPGFQYQGQWTSGAIYQPGDTTMYGGYVYVSNTENNIGNVPSLDSTDWTLFNQGYEFKSNWITGTNYKIGDVVLRNGMVYEATSDNNSQDPSNYKITTTYTASGSSGTTLKVASTNNISVGMTIIGTGFTAGQTVSSITDGVTLVINRSPDGSPTDGETLTFVGANSSAWKVLSPGNYWTKTWNPLTTYVVGDIATYQNATYVCIQNTIGFRPDTDTTNTYWVFYVPHARKNSLNTYGDIESYLTTTNMGVTTSKYTAIPIGQQTYVLRNTGGVPTWTKINVRPAVYYVSTATGQDLPSYGTTWDQPWKTISYATKFVGAGTQNTNAVAILNANKQWLVAEMYQWMVYQVANANAPFSASSVFDPTKTQRDAGYIVDAVAYDLACGGNSQTVAATLAYFAFGSNSSLFDSAIVTEISYFVASLNYLSTLITSYVLPQTSPPASYQGLNGISPSISQVTTLGTTESGSIAAATTLLSIVTTALSTQSTSAVPAPNTGLTASIFVKTGTYAESLPIVVPANTAIIGDELRGVVVEPATSITTTCTTTTATGIGAAGLFTVTSTAGMVDQMPVQFVDPIISTSIIYSAFGGITAGQTYYIIGSTITSTQFGVQQTPNVTFTGSASVTSTSITGIPSTIGLAVGNTITGTGIPTGTTILSVGTNSITISQYPTAPSSTFTSLGQPVALTTFTGATMTVYAGDCLKDMFRLRNGTGLRNMTLTGLLGSLSAPDTNSIQRPTGGSYACLDPGLGVNDTSAWIYRRSPYVQNVTAFGNGCTALKIDGSLHNGGNKSIVCNDFTHIVSDGIGIWCTGSRALTEAVSVFSYYGYAGYFAEAGGRIRATNGNSSYGTYGVIAEGYDTSEVAATGTVYNQSSQVQATVQQAYGTNSQLLRIEYQNAGSNYFTPTTNLLNYSNNFIGSGWVSDGNVGFSKVTLAPTGNTEAWTLTGATGGPDGSYLYQNISIPPTGQTFTNVTATNIPPNTGGTGANSPATFNITVTSTAYIVTVNSPGGGYINGNQLYIAGGQLGGVNSVNDCVLTITGLTGSGIQNVSVSGTVPAGSANSYTLSLYVKQGTAPSIDIVGIFSGNTTLASGLNYNFITGVTSVNNTAITGTNPGFLAANYGTINQQLSATSVSAGWYRIWFAINDLSGLNTQLQFRVYPKGYSGTAGLYSYVYGAQVERSNVPSNTLTLWNPSTNVTANQYLYFGNNTYRVSTAGLTGTTGPAFTTGTGSSGTALLAYTGSYTPNFYLEVNTTSKYTSYANYNITGSGTGVVTIGDETRSNSVFQTRITTDQNGITGGAGYLTASNNAQAGTTQYIQLSASDTNTNGNYTGLRIFINSGTGAGQYGYISYYNSTTKIAYVLKESFTPLQITQTTSSGSLLTLANSYNTNQLYINQAVQFIPTYYTTSVTATGLATATVTQAVGGTSNYFLVSSTSGMYINMPLYFTAGSGAIFSDVTAGYQYYIYSINPTINGVPTTNTIQITQQAFGVLWPLNTVASGTMTINFPSNTSYINASTTNMVVNYPIQFTGTALGGLSVGTVYYIQDVISPNNFTIAGSLVTVTVTSTTADPIDALTVTSTASLIPLNPIVFTNVSGSENIVDSQKYYISNIIGSTSFSIASSLIIQTATATFQGSNANLITVGSTAGFVQNQPIQFVGQTFGNIQAEQIYYISVVGGDGVTFTISQSPGGQALPLSTASGSMTVRTCGSPLVLQGVTGITMTGTSTSTKTSLTIGIGAMNGTFSTQLFGGVTLGQTYYVNTIPTPGSGGTLTVSLSQGVGNSGSGSPISLNTKTGSMNLAAVGWDHLNIGTPINANLDNTSVYYIEPRTIYTAPSFTQLVSTGTYQLAANAYYTSIAYGNGLWVAVPSNNATGAYSLDGLNWSALTLPSVQNWTGIAYGNTYWVIISSGGTGNSVAATSKANGAGWTTSSLPYATTWSSISYGNGIFVALATGTNAAAYSTDYGQTWTASYLPSNHNFTATGNARISTTQYKIGTSSLYLDGTSNTYIQSASNADYVLGTGDFTIETWVYRTGNAGVNQVIIDFRSSGSSAVVPTVYLNTSYVPILLVNGTAVITGSAAVALNTWTHIAISRVSGSTYMFVNGTQSGSTYSDTNNYIQGPITIGANPAGASYFSGYLDELRIQKGIGKYTTSFTPSTTPFLSDAYTLALLHFEGANTSTTITSSDGCNTWTSLAYGNGKWIAVASTSGTVIATTTVASGGAVGSNTMVVNSATGIVAGQMVTGNGLPVGTYVSSSYTSGTTITLVNLAGTAQNFTLAASGNYNFYTAGGTVSAYTADGKTWTASTLPQSAPWMSIVYGNNMWNAVASTNVASIYTFDGITWYQSNISAAADKIVYGQGIFLALNSSSTSAFITEGGIGKLIQTVTNDGYGAVCFGYTSTTYNGVFLTLTGRGTGSIISTGAKSKGRANVTSGTITSVTLFEPGSGYDNMVITAGQLSFSTNAPSCTFTDPNVTTLALVSTRTSNGVLSSPTFYNKGQGYNTSSTSIILTGSGFADQYQTGLTIIINNLTRLPQPGDNLTVSGVSQIYKVTSAYSVYSTVAPYLEANVSLSPSVSTANSVGTGVAVSLRSLYSQARLTNHDFLNIGYGDFDSSNYPGYPDAGYSSLPNNQTVEVNYGRVFYTSTDQDGNFKVGNLFGVQQATGIVTLSASQFGLTGLNSLSLGGISVGGNSVTITQFSTDPTFTANSDGILSTQRAIKSYISSRLSQGGSNTFTGQVTAGTIVVGGTNFIRSTLPNGTTGAYVKVPGKLYVNANGVDGNMAALDFFIRNGNHRS